MAGILLSVVIVRACGRSSNHGKSGFGTAVSQPALRGLLDAPLEAGHDNPRDRRGKLKLARMGSSPRMTVDSARRHGQSNLPIAPAQRDKYLAEEFRTPRCPLRPPLCVRPAVPTE